MDLIKQSKLVSLPVESLPATYLREFGYPLKPQNYECQDINELISKLHEFVQVPLFF